MHVVGRGVHERLGRQPLALVEREPAVADRGEHVGVALRRVTTATVGWFFAAARTIDGPPMSICSTHSSGGRPTSPSAVNG